MTSEPAVLPVNFTISLAAKREIEKLRKLWNAQFADRAGVAVIGWGIFMPDSAPRSENVVVTFYGESEMPGVADAVQEVSGLKIVFFTTMEYHCRFEGKVLDHSDERGFFLNNT